MYLSVVIGLVLTTIAAFCWRSDRVHEWVWRVYLQGPGISPQPYERGVLGARIAAGFLGSVGLLLVVADLVTAAFR
jgi:hypothetical protein